MGTGQILFNAFVLLTVVSAAGVVLNRNAVNAALCLLLSLVGVSGLFVALDAYLLAFLLLLVYAGAVVALFLFIIMLLDLKEDERRHFNKIAVGLGGLSALAIAGTLVASVVKTVPAVAPAGRLAEGETKALGRLLFESHILPFEILSVLLLVAMVGAILITKKDLR